MRPVIPGTFVASLVVFAMGLAAQQSDFEGTTHGFPALRDPAGKKLADAARQRRARQP